MVDMLVQALLVRKRSPVHPFGLHGMEERLHQGVVGHLGFGPIHALDNAQLSQTALHNESPIFDSSIGVKDQPTGRSTTGYGSVESFQSQPGILASTQTPTQDAPRVLVHHHGQITPLPAGLQIGNVSHPNLIGPSRYPLEAAVGDSVEESIDAGPSLTLINPATAALQFHPTHQAGHALAPDANPLRFQCPMDPGTAIGPIAGLVNRSDARRQLLILGLASAAQSLAPAIVTAPRDLVGA